MVLCFEHTPLQHQLVKPQFLRTSPSGITITQKQASIGMGAFTALALIWLLSHIFWWTLSTSGFLTGVHMLLRDASMHKDEEDKVEMQGDLALNEEASFLNGEDIA